MELRQMSVNLKIEAEKYIVYLTSSMFNWIIQNVTQTPTFNLKILPI